MARQLADLPELAKALGTGEITLEHAATIARLADAVGPAALNEYMAILLELARQAPPRKLQIACEHVRLLLDAEGGGERAAGRRRSRYLSAGRTIDGMVHLQGLLDAASGEVVLTALHAATPVPAQYEERSPGQRRADALTDVCAGWLAAGDAPTSGGVRPQVNVTVSLRTLQAGLPERLVDARTEAGRPSSKVTPGSLLGDVPMLADGQPITPGEARRLACDAGIIPVVLGSGSEPLDVGRHARLVPVGLRRALNLRDGGCRFAGCDRPASWCDAHHIRHWADGGETSLDNMILLCAHHHTLIHEGWRVVGDPHTTVEFRRPDGTQLELTGEPRCRPPTRGP